MGLCSKNVIGVLPTRRVKKKYIKGKKNKDVFTLPSSFKYSTFMTHIHANKKCTIRKFRMFSSFKNSS